MRLDIDLAKAVFGSEEELSLDTAIGCNRCGGDGAAQEVERPPGAVRQLLRGRQVGAGDVPAHQHDQRRQAQHRAGHQRQHRRAQALGRVGGDVEEEAADGVGHQGVGGTDRHLPKPADQARVEEAGDAQHQRQADEMQRFGEGPDPH